MNNKETKLNKRPNRGTKLVSAIVKCAKERGDTLIEYNAREVIYICHMCGKRISRYTSNYIRRKNHKVMLSIEERKAIILNKAKELNHSVVFDEKESKLTRTCNKCGYTKTEWFSDYLTRSGSCRKCNALAAKERRETKLKSFIESKGGELIEYCFYYKTIKYKCSQGHLHVKTEQSTRYYIKQDRNPCSICSRASGNGLKFIK